jgi:2-haloacid dehalogenase
VTAIRAIAFDAYGTLFDVHSVVGRCEQFFPGRGKELSQLWRTTQLEYTWLRSLMGRYEDFEHVTADALRYACRALGLSLSAEAATALRGEYLGLSLYPDVRDALEKVRGRRLAILSNGSPRMLEAVVQHAGLAGAFEDVISVDRLQIFKPHPSVYQLAVDALATPAATIAFVSSNYWDIAGATTFGFRTYWINRAGAQPDELGCAPTAVLSRLDELPQALQQA